MWKSVYPYKYIDDCEKIYETLLPEKFYSHLNMKDISNAGYMHEKRLCKDFKKINLGDYHGVYVQRDTLYVQRDTRISIASSHRK